MRRWIVKQLLGVCQYLIPIEDEEEVATDDPANIMFLNAFKDETYLKLREFLMAYESCEVDCIAAVIKYKRTSKQREEKVGSIIEFVSDWEDDNASACIGIIKRLLTQTEIEAYGFPEEEA